MTDSGEGCQEVAGLVLDVSLAPSRVPIFFVTPRAFVRRQVENVEHPQKARVEPVHEVITNRLVCPRVGETPDTALNADCNPGGNRWPHTATGRQLHLLVPDPGLTDTRELSSAFLATRRKHVQAQFHGVELAVQDPREHHVAQVLVRLCNGQICSTAPPP
eukprot:CAMPEP_0183592790 /NCGR_PEP_ID=MMETSP0371-20130417/168649_1 /TAXON_ID=268820 /ORGANISM="Peridinium aciculiferum, Strain PAER-2" /LENGTH=160 /DNA_ID=CAMNT_0025804349 /DNA_START=463 /DNA_END=945 /DNA_ORIENTATION=+